MSTSLEYFTYVKEQLSLLDNLRYYPMMGEYLIYYKDKIIGGIYDGRLLVKITPISLNRLGEDKKVNPYPGASPMLVVDDIDNRQYLANLFKQIEPELPIKKEK